MESQAQRPLSRVSELSVTKRKTLGINEQFEKLRDALSVFEDEVVDTSDSDTAAKLGNASRASGVSGFFSSHADLRRGREVQLGNLRHGSGLSEVCEDASRKPARATQVEIALLDTSAAMRRP